MNTKKRSVNEKLFVRLSTYTAAAGAVFLISGQKANSEPVYSGIRNLLIDTPGVLNPLDLNGDNSTDFNVGLAWSSYIFNRWTTHSAFIQAARTGNSWIGTYYEIYQLFPDSIVSYSNYWSNNILSYYNLGFSTYTDFVGAGNAFIGVRFISDFNSMAVNYGWLRINIDGYANEFVVVDWAYEENPGDAIFVGALPENLIPPEPELYTTSPFEVYTDFPVEIWFSEPVTGFTSGDIKVKGGSVKAGTLHTTDNQHFYAVIHPEKEGIIEIHVPGSVVQDADGNLNIPAGRRLYFSYVMVPVPVLTCNSATPVSGEFDIMISFNEPVTGLEEDDFLITNGTLKTGSLTSINDSTFIATITPIATGNVVIDLPAGVVQDADLYDNLSAQTLIIAADFDSPRVTLSANIDAPVSAPFGIIIEFSEKVTGLQEYEIAIVNGFVSAGSLSTTDSITYELQVTPAETGEIIIQVPAGIAQDIDGFSNLESEPLIVLAEIPDAIKTIPVSEIKIYPNPGRGVFTVETGEEFSGGQVSIYNYSGELVWVKQHLNTESTIDLSNLTEGFYLIRLTKGALNLTRKIVID